MIGLIISVILSLTLTALLVYKYSGCFQAYDYREFDGSLGEASGHGVILTAPSGLDLAMTDAERAAELALLDYSWNADVS